MAVDSEGETYLYTTSIPQNIYILKFKQLKWRRYIEIVHTNGSMNVIFHLQTPELPFSFALYHDASLLKAAVNQLQFYKILFHGRYKFHIVWVHLKELQQCSFFYMKSSNKWSQFAMFWVSFNVSAVWCLCNSNSTFHVTI